MKILIFVALFVSTIGSAKTMTGRAVKIVDGDTFDFLDARRQKHRIRLTAIDCPESKQGKHGPLATRRLSELLRGKELRITWDKRDFAKRIVGMVFAGNTDLGLEMVREGYCVYFRRYAAEITVAERGAYDEAETIARAAQKGLWSEAKPIMPWDFRKLERRKKRS